MPDKNRSDKFSVVYDSWSSHIIPVTADHAGAKRFHEAVIELLGYLRSLRDRYKHACSDVERLTKRRVYLDYPRDINKQGNDNGSG